MAKVDALTSQRSEQHASEWRVRAHVPPRLLHLFAAEVHPSVGATFAPLRRPCPSLVKCGAHR